MIEPRFIAHAYKPKIVLLVVLGLGFVALSVWMIVSARTSARTDLNVIRMIGIVGGAYFGLASYEWARLLFLSESLIEIDGAGILWRSWSDARIPWQEIGSARSQSVKGQPFIRLTLSPAARSAGRPPRRFMARLGKLVGGGDLSLTNQGSDRTFEEMRDAIRHHAPRLIT